MAERTARGDNFRMARWHAGALSFYAFVSWLVIAHGAGLNGPIFGHGADPYAFIWFLAWYPFAIAHHLNLFWSHYAWQPLGVNLAWMSAVPALAIPVAPLTVWFGPVAVYNFLVLTAPVVSAWCMYRLCCRISGDPVIAVTAGFLFGFSTYEAAQVSTLNLSTTFLLPCLGWTMLVRAQGGMSRLRAVTLIAIAAVGQFLISTEIFAITIVFGALTWGLSYGLAPTWRAVLRVAAFDVLIAGAVAGIVLLPVLVLMFSDFPYIRLPKLWPYFFAASPAGFFIPGPNNLLSWQPAQGLLNGFLDDYQEQDTYLGWPLLAIMYLYARRNRQDRRAQVLVVTVVILMIFSLGPHLWEGQKYTNIRLPWALVMRLPLLDGALPVRFALFVSFFAAIIATLWMSEAADEDARRRRLGAGILACIAIWPAPRAHTVQPQAVFFAPGRVEAVLGRSKQLLILPFSYHGASSFWQVESGFGFTQTGGYLGFPPRAMQHFDVIFALTAPKPDGIKPADVADFAQGTKADYIVAGPGTPAAEIAVIAQLHWRERKVDDVTIFDVPAAGGTGG